ncbi:CvpA family protein [Flavobacteriaceae bacterium]|jgi:membrane protein required for colicin V production|nr:CvpA family protein [Flavobacteriaceae bacterium]|tara:strand:- start:5122 stop:5640 length:519 start_codon:yes stop_codon:yes gene_type:complete
MSVIDIIIGALILYGIVKGLFKGLFVEVTSLLALVVGIYGAVHFSKYAAQILSNNFDWSQNTTSITAFAVTFVVIVLAISLAGKALTKLADFAALGLLNKLLGALFGGTKIALIISVLLLILSTLNQTIPFVSSDEIERSLLYSPVKSLAPMILPDLMSAANEIELPSISTP